MLERYDNSDARSTDGDERTEGDADPDRESAAATEMDAARDAERLRGTLLDGSRTTILHHADQTLVRARVPRHWNGHVACVFDSAKWPRKLSRPGFGEMHLLGRGYAVCAVRCERNSWYDWLTPDLVAGIAAWMDALAPGIRLGYGSSMGGYAAIRFSAELGLTRVVAHSPQASITALFENRYDRFLPEMDRHDPVERRHIAPDARFDIYFDPLIANDAAQADLLATAIGSREALVPLRYAGHPTAMSLQEAGLLKGATEHRVTRHQWVAGRRRSATYLTQLARQLRMRHTEAARLFLDRAIELDPADGTRHWLLARSLAALGLTERARTEAEIAVAIAPRNANAIVFLARMLVHRDPGRAIALARLAKRRRPHDRAIEAAARTIEAAARTIIERLDGPAAMSGAGNENRNENRNGNGNGNGNGALRAGAPHADANLPPMPNAAGPNGDGAATPPIAIASEAGPTTASSGAAPPPPDRRATH